MTPSRLRAGVVIALIVVCSLLAGAAPQSAAVQRMAHRHPQGQGGPGRGSPEQDARRRSDMMDRMTKELDLSATQRAGIDSVMQRTDSSLRAIRTEMQPRLKQVFQASRVEMEARLDSAQRIMFAKFQPQGGRGPRRP
jgi:Spy/CpxP family protein refolding chaperone